MTSKISDYRIVSKKNNSLIKKFNYSFIDITNDFMKNANPK